MIAVCKKSFGYRKNEKRGDDMKARDKEVRE
jgi:hypothetical protein